MKRGSVLLVEDDPDDIELTLLSLRKFRFEYPVEIVNDGMQALQRLSRADEGKIALIVLDLNLPKVGGLELLQMMRKKARLRELPVVILTSSNEPRDRRAAESFGVLAYFLKPIDLNDFAPIAERIRTILKETPAPLKRR